MNQEGRGKPGGRTFSNGSLHITGISAVNSKYTGKNLPSPINLLPSSLELVKNYTKPRKSPHEDANLPRQIECTELTPCNTIILRTASEGRIEAIRTEKERECNPDRLSLDRRSLTTLPILLNESKLRLLSLQHNLLTRLDHRSLENLSQLVFLDVYNNQLETMTSLNCLKHLRVLLLGKNRLKSIENLDNLTKLEVLDLHGNQIVRVCGLTSQSELKVLNLAGNEIKMIASNDLKGLCSLQELNLRRNRIKYVSGFTDTPQLFKLFLNNNEITAISDIENLKYLRNLKEIGLEGNPVCALSECILFVASYVPSIASVDRIAVTDDTKRAAHVWRMKENFKQTVSDDGLNNNSVDNVSEKKNCRVRSASENRISYLRNAKSRRPVKSGSTSSVESVFSRQKSTAPKSASMMQLPTKRTNLSGRLKRTNFSKQKSTSVSESFNESECGVTDCFRLPPILSPILSELDDYRNNCNSGGVVAVKSAGTTSTSLESNKSCRTSVIHESRANVHPMSSDSSSSASSANDDSGDERDESGNSKSVLREGETSLNEYQLKLDNAAATFTTCGGDSNNGDEKEARVITVERNLSVIPVKTKFNSICCKLKQKKTQRLDKVQERGGDYFVEIAGRYLNVNGKSSAKFIDRAWNAEKASDVTTVRFNSVCFNSLCGVFNKLKFRFPNAEHFVFTNTNIAVLGQLNALADIQGLTSVHIIPDGNTIAQKNWKNYAIFRLHHWGLQYIDGVMITEKDITLASEEYKGLGDVVLYSLPDCLLSTLLSKLRLQMDSHVGLKQWLYDADPTLRDVICKEALQWRSPNFTTTQSNDLLREKGRQNLNETITKVCSSIHKLKILERDWPSILQTIVSDTLTDYCQMDSYVKTKMNEMNIS